MSFVHQTVLLNEAVQGLAPRDGGIYVDCTLGGGGHTEALLERTDCRVIGMDRDSIALSAARERLYKFGDRFVGVHACFSDLDRVLIAQGVEQVDGILADIGVSSPQIDLPERGFSFRTAGPIDMRMDPEAALSAEEIVNSWEEQRIGQILREYGEEHRWRSVARKIVEGRPWSDTLSLAAAIRRAVGGKEGRIHPATRSFQALRIAVNDELGELTRLLEVGIKYLRPEGRFVIITFHSLEDRIVKHFFAQQAGRGVERDPYGRFVRPPSLSLFPSIIPSTEETNTRARSARMRVAVRLP